MNEQRPLEYCFNCGSPTGKAGQGDGSLYCECDAGPFCDDCWEIHHRGNALLIDRDALVRYVRAKRLLKERKKHKPANGRFLNFMETEALLRCERAVADAHKALSQELKDAISEGDK